MTDFNKTLNTKFYQIGFVGLRCSERTDATKTWLILAFRKCCDNASINSLRHAANSFFDWKLKRYKFLSQLSISRLTIYKICLAKCSKNDSFGASG